MHQDDFYSLLPHFLLSIFAVGLLGNGMRRQWRMDNGAGIFTAVAIFYCLFSPLAVKMPGSGRGFLPGKTASD